MPPKSSRTANTRPSRGVRSTMSKSRTGDNTNQPRITDLGAATSKKGAVRKTRREGGIGSKISLDKKPTKESSPKTRVVGSKLSCNTNMVLVSLIQHASSPSRTSKL